MNKPPEAKDSGGRNYSVCAECVVAPLLKESVSSFGKLGDCSLCFADRTTVVATTLPAFVKAVKSLVRYHFSEGHYGTIPKKSGGLGLLIMAHNNLFFRHPSQLSLCAFESIVHSTTDAFNIDKEISLFSAYCPPEAERHKSGGLLGKIIDGEHRLIRTIESELVNRNHFLVTADVLDEFKQLMPFVSCVVDKSETFFRARIGAIKKAYGVDRLGKATTDYYTAFEKADIGAPPIHLSAAGRLNRPGISFLYLASKEQTAIAEVRPHPGEEISLGAFRAVHNIEVADFTTHSLSKLYRTDEELELLRLIISIENTLATLAPPTNQSVYSTTQLIADVVRQLGFKGMKFRSTVGDENSFNLTLFDAGLMSWVENSGTVYQVEKVEYSCPPRAMYPPDNEPRYLIQY